MEIRICVLINRRCPGLPILFGRLPHKTGHIDCKIDHDNLEFCYCCCFTKPDLKRYKHPGRKQKQSKAKQKKKCLSTMYIRLISDASGIPMEESRVLRGEKVTKGINYTFVFIY